MSNPSPLQARVAAASPWTVIRERDVAYLPVGGGEVLVVTCDSDGGIGPKPADTVAVDAELVGRFAARVPLLELLAVGATATLVVDALAVERHPTGEAIISGVLTEASAAGLGADAVTGSTEDNVPTVATGIGVTVIGHCRVDDLRPGRARIGGGVALLGRPMSAPADRFDANHPEILHVGALLAALDLPGVDEILPIGSGGTHSELVQLTATIGARFALGDAVDVDLARSGGPSTAALVAFGPDAGPADLEELSAVTGLAVRRLGTIVA